MNIPTENASRLKPLLQATACLVTFLAGMAPSWQADATVAQTPLTVSASFPPIAMLNISKDHQLFYKAYNDFSDLNGDGELDTSYVHEINYYGYFDSFKCYSYASGVFSPASETSDKYCSGNWSGNFLNWVSMSRMDIVRKLLYGGMRSTDTATSTILERAHLPHDAHAWAKYYNGSDLGQLTPFGGSVVNSPITYSTSGSNQVKQYIRNPPTESGNQADNDLGQFFSVSDVAGIEAGDQVQITTSGDPDVHMEGTVFVIDNGNMYIEVYRAAGTGTYSSWTITDLSSTGISFCNVTYEPPGEESQNSTAPPLIRVAKGNFALWSANERSQCLWSDEMNRRQAGFSTGFRSNGNRQAFSQLEASAENPIQSVHAIGQEEYIVRVEACVDGLLGAEKCKQYPDGNYKPIGLLQEFSDDGQILFGLFTGSYDKNISGGVLRKNAEPFSTEVNVNTDGTFKNVEGIVSNLDALRIYGFEYGLVNNYGIGDNCTFQLTDINEGDCRSWGNPMSEIYLESLRYLAGLSPQSAFTGNGAAESSLGLTVATWEDKITQANYCVPLNVLNFNASVSSYDADDMGAVSDLGAASSAVELTNTVGDDEGINGGLWFVGNTASDQNDLCSAKTVSGLGNVTGICPEAPSIKGTYLMSGVAWYANTNRIRSDITVPADAPPPVLENALTVKTYGVALATNVPKIEIPVPGSEKIVTILPAYRLDISSNGSGPFGAGTLVDFKVIQPHREQAGVGTGTFYVNWEDSEQGGDYDQDVWGLISYSITGTTIEVTTDAVSASTSNGQGFGYVISGTTQDGTHFHSGILDFDYTDPTDIGVTPSGSFINASGGCDNCELPNPPTTATYTIGDSSAGVLKDPLWYTAKWGGFDDMNNNDLPDQTEEWDQDGDGVPDTFSFATNPLVLEQALRDAFQAILATTGSTASAATNTGIAVQGGTTVYQPLYKSGDWSGDLRAFTFDPDTGALTEATPFSAADVLDATDWETGRNIITMEVVPETDNNTPEIVMAVDGVAFDWDDGLSAHQQDLLDNGTADGSAATGNGEAMLEYLRGSEENEAVGLGFRDRHQDPANQDIALMGDIVGSTPIYIGPPSARFFNLSGEAAGEGDVYDDFIQTWENRQPIIYVGANDGMLHAFNADTLTEEFAYVPATVIDELETLTHPDYSHRFYVDGTPTAGDAYFTSDSTWHTVLVGTTGAGGKSVFALDITNPSGFGEANAADMVLWEINPELYPEDYGELGYTFSRPIIVRMGNDDGDWAAVFGNGYESGEGAVLYIADIEDGSLIKKIILDTSPGNGLSTPTVIDLDGDMIADRIYAGDLEGHLWVVDVTSDNESSWGTAFGNDSNPVPLFTATTPDGEAQPITVRPEVVFHPSVGRIVLFGTGRYFAVGDNVIDGNTNIQSFYGIWDSGLQDQPSGMTRSNITLVEQEIIQESTESGVSVRATTDKPVNWNPDDPDQGDMGWHMDFDSSLVANGERVVRDPTLRTSRIIFPTLIPFDDPCLGGGTGWLMELDPVTGSRLTFTPFDIDNNRTFNDSDYITIPDPDGEGTIEVPASGIQVEGGGIPSKPAIVVDPETGTEYKFITTSTGATETVLNNPGPEGFGRQSWRQKR